MIGCTAPSTVQGARLVVHVYVARRSQRSSHLAASGSNAAKTLHCDKQCDCCNVGRLAGSNPKCIKGPARADCSGDDLVPGARPLPNTPCGTSFRDLTQSGARRPQTSSPPPRQRVSLRQRSHRSKMPQCVVRVQTGHWDRLGAGGSMQHDLAQHSAHTGTRCCAMPRACSSSAVQMASEVETRPTVLHRVWRTRTAAGTDLLCVHALYMKRQS